MSFIKLIIFVSIANFAHMWRIVQSGASFTLLRCIARAARCCAQESFPKRCLAKVRVWLPIQVGATGLGSGAWDRRSCLPPRPRQGRAIAADLMKKGVHAKVKLQRRWELAAGSAPPGACAGYGPIRDPWRLRNARGWGRAVFGALRADSFWLRIRFRVVV